jgi:hypothetical protein
VDLTSAFIGITYFPYKAKMDLNEGEESTGNSEITSFNSSPS